MMEFIIDFLTCCRKSKIKSTTGNTTSETKVLKQAPETELEKRVYWKVKHRKTCKKLLNLLLKEHTLAKYTGRTRQDVEDGINSMMQNPKTMPALNIQIVDETF